MKVEGGFIQVIPLSIELTDDEIGCLLNLLYLKRDYSTQQELELIENLVKNFIDILQSRRRKETTLTLTEIEFLLRLLNLKKDYCETDEETKLIANLIDGFEEANYILKNQKYFSHCYLGE